MAAPLPDVDALRCFAAAAKLLNFRAAARAVALTPAAFSHRIKQLEDLLGVQLFARTTRKVQLTQEGMALVPRVEVALRAVAACGPEGREGSAIPLTSIIVGTRHELGLSWILPQVDALRRHLPWLELHMYFGSGADIVGRVRNMEIDCAVTSSLVMDPRLVGLRLHREDYVFVGATALLRKQPFRTMADAERFTLIDTDPTLALFRYMRDASHVEGGSSPSFGKVLCFGTIEAIRARVLSGAGVAVLPAYLVREDLAEKRLTRIMPKQALLHDYFRLIVRADDPRRALFDALAVEMAKVPLA